MNETEKANLRKEFYTLFLKKNKPTSEEQYLIFNKFIYGNTPKWSIYKLLFRESLHTQKYNYFYKTYHHTLQNKLKKLDELSYIYLIKDMKECKFKKAALLLEYVIFNKNKIINEKVDNFVEIIIKIMTKK